MLYHRTLIDTNQVTIEEMFKADWSDDNNIILLNVILYENDRTSILKKEKLIVPWE